MRNVTILLLIVHLPERPVLLREWWTRFAKAIPARSSLWRSLRFRIHIVAYLGYKEFYRALQEMVDLVDVASM